jgi:hypothetical protein
MQITILGEYTNQDRSAIGEAFKLAREGFLNMRIIGIDTGVNTGFAVWNCLTQTFETIETLTIDVAMLKVVDYKPALVRVEDARLRTWFGKGGSEKWQGVGSIKRDASIWESFLTNQKIPFELVAPKNNVTKLSPIAFKNRTQYLKRTSEHGRDAAGLVHGWTERNLKNLEQSAHAVRNLKLLEKL